MAIQKIRLTQIRSNTAAYNDFEQQVDMMSVPFYQEFTANDGDTTFSLSTNYTLGNHSLKVFLNGALQDEGIAYNEIATSGSTTAGNQIQFTEGLVAGDWVMCRIEGAGSGTTLEDHIHYVREVPTGNIDGTNTVFTLQLQPTSGTEEVFKNGLLMYEGTGEDYTISGSTITFIDPPGIGSKILVNYIHGQTKSI